MQLFCQAVTEYDNMIPEAITHFTEARKKLEEAKMKADENRYLDLKNIRTGTKLIYNHVTRYHNKSDLELYALLKPGETAKHAIEKYKIQNP